MPLKSWLSTANDPGCDFPIENLPYGVFRSRGETHIGVAIGDQILDLHACASENLLSGLPQEIQSACRAEQLNELMSLGPGAWSALRQRITTLLTDTPSSPVKDALVPMNDAAMQLPAHIGDYTDFYASIDHATRVGKLLRPDNPLLPNYKHLPIGYHGRASSIVVSGTPIRRPCGQTKSTDAAPIFGPSKSLDYELEVGIFIGPGNQLGDKISIDEAESHVFGLCLLNDWSARDIQTWEYQPLGPFLAKSFATTISPWIVPLEALAPYRMPPRPRIEGDPELLNYLNAKPNTLGGIDLALEVDLQSRQMKETGTPPAQMSQSNLRDLYWSIGQLVTHHSSNGCNLRPGDLLATGTVSGPAEGSEGCLLEMRHRATRLRLPTGEQRAFLEDGDRVRLRAFAQKPDLPRIGFGDCSGTITQAIAAL